MADVSAGWNRCCGQTFAKQAEADRQRYEEEMKNYEPSQDVDPDDE